MPPGLCSYGSRLIPGGSSVREGIGQIPSSDREKCLVFERAVLMQVGQVAVQILGNKVVTGNAALELKKWFVTQLQM